MIQQTQFILYVSDQNRSKKFYQKILQLNPVLDVPGMTEFELANNTKLGLMPEEAIAKIFSPGTVHPKSANGSPRCELYLMVDDLQAYTDRAQQNGAKLISPLSKRDWGHEVVYFSDPDGHIIAFAKE